MVGMWLDGRLCKVEKARNLPETRSRASTISRFNKIHDFQKEIPPKYVPSGAPTVWLMVLLVTSRAVIRACRFTLLQELNQKTLKKLIHISRLTTLSPAFTLLVLHSQPVGHRRLKAFMDEYLTLA